MSAGNASPFLQHIVKLIDKNKIGVSKIGAIKNGAIKSTVLGPFLQLVCHKDGHL